MQENADDEILSVTNPASGRVLMFVAAGAAIIVLASPLELVQPLKRYAGVVDNCWRRGDIAGCISGAVSRSAQHPDWIMQSLAIPGGDERAYLIRRPNDKGPRPTIVMFHGAHGNGLEAAVASGLGQAAPQQGFVAVFPNASGGFWNAFPKNKVPLSVLQRAGKNIRDDVSFIKELVASLVHSGIADPHRIYIAGFSMGGFMALEMVCADTEDFAGVALISSSMPAVTGEGCAPTKPLPLLVLNGDDDKSVPYEGGILFPGKYEVWSTDRTLAFFRDLNGCSIDAESKELPLGNPGQVTQIMVRKWFKCSDKQTVLLYRVRGGHHEFPIGVDVPRTLMNFFKPDP